MREGWRLIDLPVGKDAPTNPDKPWMRRMCVDFAKGRPSRTFVKPLWLSTSPPLSPCSSALPPPTFLTSHSSDAGPEEEGGKTLEQQGGQTLVALSATNAFVASKEEQQGGQTLVALRPLTGRSHQLRVHMHSLGVCVHVCLCVCLCVSVCERDREVTSVACPYALSRTHDTWRRDIRQCRAGKGRTHAGNSKPSWRRYGGRWAGGGGRRRESKREKFFRDTKHSAG